jgi:hypothetical protein
MKILFSGMVLMTCVACGNGDELKCGGSGEGGDSLDGSYCEDVPITFTDAEVRRQNSGEQYFIFVRYLDATANTVEPRKVLEILIPSSAVVIEPNRQILIRMVQGATVRRFPSADEGAIQAIDLTAELQDTSQLTFTEFTGEIDSSARGEFGFLFDSGRTLSGTFSGAIIENRPE